MSIAVISAVLGRKVGGPVRKIILVKLADCANDDGTGIWPSKATIAAEAECHKDTVKKHIRDMVTEGLLTEVGKKPCSNGFTTAYNMDLDVLNSYPLTTGRNKHPVVLDPADKGGQFPPVQGADNTPNRKKPSGNRPSLFGEEEDQEEPEKPKTGQSPEEIFEKLWKQVLEITPRERKGRHSAKDAQKVFMAIVSRKNAPIPAATIAHAVLWFYDSEDQKKKDRQGVERGYMKGLGPLLRSEVFANFIPLGAFVTRTRGQDIEEDWKRRADYVNENQGEWPPSAPSPRTMPHAARPLVQKQYWAELFPGWSPKS